MVSQVNTSLHTANALSYEEQKFLFSMEKEKTSLFSKRAHVLYVNIARGHKEKWSMPHWDDGEQC